MTTDNLIIIPPITMTDAKLISHSVAENDYDAWVSGTAYHVGDRVMYLPNHSIYQCVANYSGTVSPDLNPTHFVYVTKTNRWRMFDTSSSSTTTSASTISVRVRPSEVINSVALFGLYGQTVQVRLIDPVEGTAYNQTKSLNGTIGQNNWYSYFFDVVDRKDQALFTDLPAFGTADVYIDVTTVGGNAAIGSCVIGRAATYGLYVTLGARVGIVDYSRKETNAFGETNLIERAYTNKAEFDIWIRKSETDSLKNKLASLRATPAVYIATDKYSATTIFGFYKDFGITLSYPDVSVCNLIIEGLT
jgi:hypothetical protein